MLFDAKILLLLLRNNKITWTKSIKLISCCNEKWLESNSFFKTLIQISYDESLPVITLIDIPVITLIDIAIVEEALRDWLMQKFKKLGMTLLSLHRNKISKSSSALRRWQSSFSNFRVLLSVLWPHLLCKMSDVNLDLGNCNQIRKKNTIAATLISIFDDILIF